MPIDRAIAEALHFPKSAFAVVEHERRWLCRDFPHEQVTRSETITDLYVTGTQLRLREARSLDGRTARLRLTRKASVDARTHLVTSIYLPEQEFAVLAAALPGLRLTKLRHRLQSPPDIVLSVDQFQGALAGLTMVEAEFNSADLMASFRGPDFADREVTDDRRYGAGHLVRYGIPT
ncbi:MAG: hypothetical protein ISP45_30205 [Reyranella sp.]|nr:hypothetical protein [Reyranella sp.]